MEHKKNKFGFLNQERLNSELTVLSDWSKSKNASKGRKMQSLNHKTEKEGNLGQTVVMSTA